MSPNVLRNSVTADASATVMTFSDNIFISLFLFLTSQPPFPDAMYKLHFSFCDTLHQFEMFPLGPLMHVYKQLKESDLGNLLGIVSVS